MKFVILILLTAGLCQGSPVEPRTKEIGIINGTKPLPPVQPEVKKVERDLTKLSDNKNANHSLPVDATAAIVKREAENLNLASNASKPISRRETVSLKNDTKKIATRATEDLKANVSKVTGSKARRDVSPLANATKPEESTNLKGSIIKRDTMGMPQMGKPPKGIPPMGMMRKGPVRVMRAADIKVNDTKVAESKARRDVSPPANSTKPEEIPKLKGSVTKRDTMGIPPMGMMQVKRVMRAAVQKNNASSIKPKLAVKPKRNAEKLGALLNATKDEKKASHAITKRDTVSMQNGEMMPVRAMMMKRETVKSTASKNGTSKVSPRAAPASKLPANGTKSKQRRSAEKLSPNPTAAKDDKKASHPISKRDTMAMANRGMMSNGGKMQMRTMMMKREVEKPSTNGTAKGNSTIIKRATKDTELPSKLRANETISKPKRDLPKSIIPALPVSNHSEVAKPKRAAPAMKKEEEEDRAEDSDEEDKEDEKSEKFESLKNDGKKEDKHSKPTRDAVKAVGIADPKEPIESPKHKSKRATSAMKNATKPKREADGSKTKNIHGDKIPSQLDHAQSTLPKSKPKRDLATSLKEETKPKETLGETKHESERVTRESVPLKKMKAETDKIVPAGKPKRDLATDLKGGSKPKEILGEKKQGTERITRDTVPAKTLKEESDKVVPVAKPKRDLTTDLKGESKPKEILEKKQGSERVTRDTDPAKKVKEEADKIVPAGKPKRDLATDLKGGSKPKEILGEKKQGSERVTRDTVPAKTLKEESDKDVPGGKPKRDLTTDLKGESKPKEILGEKKQGSERVTRDTVPAKKLKEESDKVVPAGKPKRDLSPDKAQVKSLSKPAATRQKRSSRTRAFNAPARINPAEASYEVPASYAAPEPLREEPKSYAAPEPIRKAPKRYPAREQPKIFRAPEPVREEPKSYSEPIRVVPRKSYAVVRKQIYKAPEPVREAPIPMRSDYEAPIKPNYEAPVVRKQTRYTAPVKSVYEVPQAPVKPTYEVVRTTPAPIPVREYSRYQGEALKVKNLKPLPMEATEAIEKAPAAA